MLYREIMAVCSETHTKHINTPCGQNVEFLNVKPDGAWSNHWVLKVLQLDTWGREEMKTGLYFGTNRNFSP